MGSKELVLGAGISHPRPLRHPSKPLHPAEPHTGVVRVQGGWYWDHGLKQASSQTASSTVRGKTKPAATWTTWDVYAGMS